MVLIQFDHMTKKKKREHRQHLTFWFLKTGFTLAIGLIFVGYLEDLKKTVTSNLNHYLYKLKRHDTDYLIFLS